MFSHQLFPHMLGALALSKAPYEEYEDYEEFQTGD